MYINCRNKILGKKTKEYSAKFLKNKVNYQLLTEKQEEMKEKGFNLCFRNTRLARIEVQNFHFKFCACSLPHFEVETCIVCKKAKVSVHYTFSLNVRISKKSRGRSSLSKDTAKEK